jgi:hypothetical protein
MANKKPVITQEDTSDNNSMIRCDNIRFGVDYSNKNTLFGLDIENWAYVYKKTVIFDSESCVTAYDKKNEEIFTKDYYKSEKPLYISPKNSDESVIGLFDHWLFIDGGTSPGPHQLKIVDLNSRKLVFDGEWYTGKKVIDRIDDTTFIVYKYNNDRKYIDENANDIYYCTLSAYSLNLETLALVPLNYSVKVYGQ